MSILFVVQVEAETLLPKKIESKDSERIDYKTMPASVTIPSDNYL